MKRYIVIYSMLEIQKIIEYAKRVLVHTRVSNPEDIANPIVSEMKRTVYPKVNTSEIVSPLISKLYDLELAINEKNIELPDFDKLFSELSESLQKEVAKINFTPEINVSSPSVEITNDFEELVKKLKPHKEPKDKGEVVKYLKELKGAILGITFPEGADFSETNKLLQDILDKPQVEFPDFPRDKKGIPYFTPTIVSQGGGGTYDAKVADKQGQFINPATEEKQDAIISALGGTNQVLYDKTSGELDYKGKNASATAVEGDTDWSITKYVRSGGLTQKITKTGSWTDRVSLF